MRRRSHDVFELGQEQLADEPAVELGDAEDPPVPPPAGGPVSEAEGSEGPATERAAVRLPRPPRLGAVLSGRAVTVLAALAAGVAVVIGVGRLMQDESPRGRETLVAPAGSPASAARAARQHGVRIRREHPSSSRPPRAGTKEAQGTNRAGGGSRVKPQPSEDPETGEGEPARGSEPTHQPAPQPAQPQPAAPAPAPASEGPRPTDAEILAREFGP